MSLFAKAQSQSFELSPIKAIELAAAKTPGAISLAQGIPSFPTAPEIREFVKEKIDQGLCDRYSLTPGLRELREEISISLLKDGLSYDPEGEIIVTAGSIEAITASVLACTSPGDEIIIPSPTYASYLGSIGIAGCTPKFVELDEDNNFDFHVDQIRKAITSKTSAVLYCSPNNPTGTLYSERKTRELIALCQAHNLTVIIDEVYKDFYFVDEPHFTPALIPDARKQVIRIFSFSKAFAMTGWRVGFVHSDRSRIETILKYHDAMVTCAPVVSQYAAIAAIRNADVILGRYKGELRERRNYTIQILDQLSHVLDYQTPKATYFVFPRVKGSFPLANDSRKLAYDILEKVGVAVVPGIAFGPSGESHFRICYGRDPDDLSEGMTRITDYFAGRSKARSTIARDGSKRSTKSVRILGSIAKYILTLGAKAYLARTKPIIVGIAGTYGKTTFKRALTESLSKKFKTRSSILSYNTESGLPLSILSLKAPTSGIEKFFFVFRLLGKALLAKEEAELLVLEYGILTEDDGSSLAKILIPNWLIITGVAGADPTLDYRSILRGIRILADRLPEQRVLWPEQDPLLAEAFEAKKLSVPFASKGFVSRADLVGESARLAAAAGAKLESLLAH